ncbi:AfsR/SARP family transcriptional regulator [Actinocatenispora rupis]|uniref:SARP family transcriptional regulator n=1 Tax=Actinocatenispora rupis TaxID=519421 RepID=A0A8J3JHY1_9ACTN|nr:BTAD domain-containing putative transcriptional regulator [Actinocatenispora rupis]GID15288.1 SARP family transcriptional regulator [Actinocatenispora rupis]
MADLRLLGPVEIRSDGRLLDTGTAKQQAVLAVLLLDADRPVPVDTLIGRVWGDAPPPTARGTLQAHLSRIRRTLTGVADLEHRAGAYRLRVDRDDVDLYRARRLVADSRTGGVADERRAELLRTAAGSWRGEPLSGLDGAWFGRMRETLLRQRLDILAEWAGVALRLGDAGAVVDVLGPVHTDEPLVEPVAEALMRALAATGREAEALTVYDTFRRGLADALGADPSTGMQRLYREILAGDPAPRPAPPAGPRPAQLPGDLGALFSGRTEQLGRLDKALGAASLVVVSGAAGVGKTSLVVRWARGVADRFPDGQLHTNLLGHSPGPSAEPRGVLRRFLTALGVDARRIPAGQDELVDLYRSMLADRRVLVVLDNARDADQVRPLLPGSAASLVVVTSRNQLPGLIAAEGAVPLPLDEPSHGEALDLLARRLGAERVAAEPAAVDRVVRLCDRLPLALSVFAAGAALRPEHPLTALADALAATPGRLDALDLGDDSTDVRAAFSWSYAALGADAQRLYRLVGLHPGPEVSLAAAADLTGWPEPRTRRALTELTRAHLLTEPVPARYGCHDLLREHAAELAADTDTPADRDAALARLLDGYLHTAHAAAVLLDTHREQLVAPPVHPRADTPAPLADHGAALTWLTTEYPNLLAALHLCARRHLDRYTWHLAWCLYPLYYNRGHWTEQVNAQQLALAAAQRRDDTHCAAYSEHALAVSYQRLDRRDEALDRFRNAIALYDRLDDPASRARVHYSLAWLHTTDEEYEQAIEQARLGLQYDTGTGRGRALETIGWGEIQLGRPTDAIASLTGAVDIYREQANRNGEAAATDSLGDAYTAAGDHATAITCYQRAVDLTAELGDRYHEALCRHNLGIAYHRAGRTDDARAALTASLAILDAIGHADAAHVRATLTTLDPPVPAAQPSSP